MIEMILREIQRSHITPFNVVLLFEKDGDRYFPIYIGTEEARATDNALFNREAARPLTHDLIGNVLVGLGATLEGVLVDSLSEETFHGKLLLKTADDRHVKIDSRPSDAIVLATKYKVPIFVSEEVLSQAYNT
ncbi:MAG: bifunctional nuclease family protein [Sumerlaeia bacterium]